MMQFGKFITFEGGEGSGKSTQAKLLAERLRSTGIDIVLTREPGGTAFAEQVRDFILWGQTAPHGALADALLFYAARADHLDKVIRPALAQGRWVIADRFSDSTCVYQSLAGDLPADIFGALEDLVVGSSAPALTFILDVPVDIGLARAEIRRRVSAGARQGHDPYEARDADFHNRLRDGYLRIAREEPGRCVVIDATRSIDCVAAEIWASARSRLDLS
jgi:dTMP kinase